LILAGNLNLGRSYLITNINVANFFFISNMIFFY
jgi:hypothetical protein